MLRKRIVLFLFIVLSIASNLSAAHSWTLVNNGFSSNPFLQLRVIAQDNGQRLIFLREYAGGLALIRERLAGRGDWELPQSLGNPPDGVRVTAPIIPVMEADGRVVIFVRGSDGRIWFRAQDVRNGSFQGWVRHSNSIVQNFTVARNRLGDGRLEIFSIENGTLRRSVQFFAGSAFGFWENIGGNGTLRTPIAVDINADGRLQIFVVGSDGRLYSAFQRMPSSPDYDWTGYGHPDALDATDLSTARLSDGRIAVFQLHGPSSTIAMSLQTTPSSIAFNPPHALNGWGISPGIRATTTSFGRLSLFVIGGDTRIYSTTQQEPNPFGLWSGWPAANASSFSIDVLPRDDGTVEIFSIDTQNRVMQGRE